MKPQTAAAVILALVSKQAGATSTNTAERDFVSNTADGSSPSQPLPSTGTLLPVPIPVVAPETQPAGRSTAREPKTPKRQDVNIMPPLVVFPYYPMPEEEGSADKHSASASDLRIALALVAAAAILWG